MLKSKLLIVIIIHFLNLFFDFLNIALFFLVKLLSFIDLFPRASVLTGQEEVLFHLCFDFKGRQFPLACR